MERHAAVADDGMGGMESTESFLAHLDEAVTEARSTGCKLRTWLKTLDAEEAGGDGDGEEALVEYEGNWGDEYDACATSGDDAAESTIDPSEFRAECILGRRLKRDVLYYKVKWHGHNLVTWERDDDVENRRLVDEYEALFRLRSRMPAFRGMRPPTYISRRRMARILKAQSAPGATVAAVGSWAPTGGVGVASTAAASLPPLTVAAGRTYRRPLARDQEAQWICEVEPSIWIPYEHGVQDRLERDYQASKLLSNIFVAGRTYSIDLDNFTQSGGAGVRRVQRVVRRTVEAERVYVQSLSLDELRRYIGELPDLNEAHYEALSRLSDEDKVTKGTPKEQLSVLERTTFEGLMNRIADGVELPGFTTECLMCLEDYVATDRLVLLPVCSHFFHESCATKYFERFSGFCPVCKQAIS